MRYSRFPAAVYSPAGDPPSPPPAPAGAPPSDGAPAAARPEWLPEAHWDTTANAIKPEFGAHYTELSTFHKTASERDTALKARKPEDIKIELPKEFKIPEGSGIKPEQLKINDKDPRIAPLRAFAQKHGISQEAVSDLVAFDAELQIAAYTADQTARAAELTEANKALGEKAQDRRNAVANWVNGLVSKGELTADEAAAIPTADATPAVITLMEKLIAKANGTIPGHVPSKEPPGAKPGDIPGYDTMTFEQRRAAQWNRTANG